MSAAEPPISGTRFPKRLQRFIEFLPNGSPGEIRKHFVRPASLATHLKELLPFLSEVAASLFLAELYDLAEMYYTYAQARHPDPQSAEGLTLSANIATSMAKQQRCLDALPILAHAIDAGWSRRSDAGIANVLVRVLLVKGQLHARLDDRRQSARTLKTGLELAAGHPHLNEVRGSLFYELGFGYFLDGKHTEAAQHFANAALARSSVASASPRSLMSAQLMLGRALLRSDNHPRGLEELRGVANYSSGTDADDLKLAALAELATDDYNGERLSSALKWIELGKSITPPTEEARASRMALDVIAIKCMPDPIARRRAFKIAIDTLERLSPRPSYASRAYTSCFYGLVESYLDEGDRDHARTCALTAADKSIAYIRRDDPESPAVADFIAMALQLQSDEGLKFYLKRIRYRKAYPTEDVLTGGWQTPELTADFARARTTCVERINICRSRLPDLPEIELEFLHNDTDPRGSVVMTKSSALIAVRSGAILRIRETIDTLIRSPDFLQLWHLEALATKRTAVIDSFGFRLIDPSSSLDPFRREIRALLFELAVDYLISHELCHVIHGHLAYLNGLRVTCPPKTGPK